MELFVHGFIIYNYELKKGHRKNIVKLHWNVLLQSNQFFQFTILLRIWTIDIPTYILIHAR